MIDAAGHLAPARMTISSRALGDIEVDTSDAWTFAEPLPGFPSCTSYVIVPHLRADGGVDSTIQWLQALEPPYHAFVITDPWGVVPDYAPEISDADAAALGLRSFEDARVLAILTVPRDPTEISINLRAPVVLNVADRVGKQVVLLNDEYQTRHPVRGD